MASTRNKNTNGNYQLEKMGNNNFSNWIVYDNYATPTASYFPGNGLLMGRIGSSQLSSNFYDIESNLRGIGANNLENPLPQCHPQINSFQWLNICNRADVILPETFMVSNTQKPLWRN